MAKTLKELIKNAESVSLSSEEQEQQRRSFAYGNASIENEFVTRQVVDTAAAAISPSAPIKGSSDTKAE